MTCCSKLRYKHDLSYCNNLYQNKRVKKPGSSQESLIILFWETSANLVTASKRLSTVKQVKMATYIKVMHIPTFLNAITGKLTKVATKTTVPKKRRSAQWTKIRISWWKIAKSTLQSMLFYLGLQVCHQDSQLKNSGKKTRSKRKRLSPSTGFRKTSRKVITTNVCKLLLVGILKLCLTHVYRLECLDIFDKGTVTNLISTKLLENCEWYPKRPRELWL